MKRDRTEWSHQIWEGADMQMQIECLECHVRYVVKQELAGTVIQCHHCGRKFRVPYRARVNQLESSDLAPAEHEASPRSFSEYGALGKQSNRKHSTAHEQPLVRLPDLVSELWLPLGISLLCYGISVYLATTSALACSNPRSGLILLSVAVLVFLSVVMPLVRRVVEAAAATLDVTLPNSVWLQTAAMCSIPAAGMMIGMVQGDMPVTGMICGGLIGGVLAVPTALFLYQVSPGKTVQIAVLIFISFGVLAATAGVVITGGLSLLLASWHEGMPWTPPASKTETVVAPEPAVPVRSPNLPTIAPAPSAVIQPRRETVAWTAKVDGGSQDGLQFSFASLPATSTSTAVSALPAGSFTAVVEKDVCYVYDLRDESLIGCIEESLRPDRMFLSPDGKYAIAAVEQAARQPRNIQFGGASSTSYEASGYTVWSTADGRPISRFAPGFIEANRILHVGHNGTAVAIGTSSPQSAQIIDLMDAKTVRSVAIGSPRAVSVSPGGSFLAAREQKVIRIYDLQAGRLAGECDLPESVAAADELSLCFSPNGAYVGAIVPGQNSTSLLFWSMKDGKFVGRSELQGSTSEDLLWVPDSSLFLWNGQLVDLVTGKLVYTIEPGDSAPNARPARAMLSPYHLLVEERQASAGDRVTYSVVPLVKAKIDVSLAEIRGSAWQPAEYPAAFNAAAPAVPRLPLQEVAKQEQWVVRVMLVSRQDGEAIRKQLVDQNQTLAALERSAREGKAYADKIGSERNAAATDPQGRIVYTPRYTRAQINRAEGTARRSAGDFAAAVRKIESLESELAAAQVQRTISGKLDDGTVVDISVRNPSLTATVDALRQGVRRSITGSAYESDGVLRITPRLIQPLPLKTKP